MVLISSHALFCSQPHMSLRGLKLPLVGVVAGIASSAYIFWPIIQELYVTLPRSITISYSLYSPHLHRRPLHRSLTPSTLHIFLYLGFTLVPLQALREGAAGRGRATGHGGRVIHAPVRRAQAGGRGRRRGQPGLGQAAAQAPRRRHCLSAPPVVQPLGSVWVAHTGHAAGAVLL